MAGVPSVKGYFSSLQKTVNELTQEWGLTYNIEMEYTESDYEDCVDHKSYSSKIKPILTEDYPDLTPSQVTTLLKAFWHEFKENNPKLQAKKSEYSRFRIALAANRQQFVTSFTIKICWFLRFDMMKCIWRLLQPCNKSLLVNF